MPRLTEQEQQEIIRFMKADKPLPEKYRFLLFEDKREVELTNFSVMNVSRGGTSLLSRWWTFLGMIR